MKAKHRTKRIQRYRKMLGIIVLMLTITLIGVVVSATVLYKRKNKNDHRYVVISKSGTPGGNRTHNGPLGVLKNSQIPIKISIFRTFLGGLSNIFRLNRLFSFVFSANFRFQNNFQNKIIPKTIPIFIAVFKKNNAQRHSFFGCYDIK